MKDDRWTYMTSIGMLACMSSDTQLANEFIGLIEEGFNAVIDRTYELREPRSVLALASVCLDCGDAAKAKQLCAEALQKISSREAQSGFALERTEALFKNCLIEMEMGRPDLGANGCEALSRYLKGSKVL